MLRGIRLWLKDKVVFSRIDGKLVKRGSFIPLLKSLDCDFLHIVDLDALKGFSINFDLYDAATYIKNIQVEVASNFTLVSKLFNISARAVIENPSEDFRMFSKRLVVKVKGRAESSYVEWINDYYLEEFNEQDFRFLIDCKKRIFIRDVEVKGAFAVIKDLK